MVVCEQLAKQPTAPARARRLLDCLGPEVPADRLDDARLLVSEVVTNAVEHVQADGPIEIVVRYDDKLLRIEVSDPGEGFTPREREPDNPRGWGLHFVGRLADRWGVQRDGHSRVWFELAA